MKNAHWMHRALFWATAIISVNVHADDGRDVTSLASQVDRAASSLASHVQWEYYQNPGRTPYEQNQRQRAVSDTRNLNFSAQSFYSCVVPRPEDYARCSMSFNRVDQDYRWADMSVRWGNFSGSVTIDMMQLSNALSSLRRYY